MTVMTSPEIERTCQGCDQPIEQAPSGRRKWCSDMCRKITLYGDECTVCGTKKYVGRPPSDPFICKACIRDEADRKARRIIKAWNEGEPAWYIAQREGLVANSLSTQIGRYREMGYDVALHRCRSREAWPEIERRYHAGETYLEIDEAMGMSLGSASQMVQRMREKGIDLPPRRYGHTDEEIAELWARDIPRREIAEILGYASQSALTLRVSRMRERGWDLPRWNKSGPIEEISS